MSVRFEGGTSRERAIAIAGFLGEAGAQRVCLIAGDVVCEFRVRATDLPSEIVGMIDERGAIGVEAFDGSLRIEADRAGARVIRGGAAGPPG